MTIKEFLLQNKEINLSQIAAKMYPELKNPRSNLNQKLHGHTKWNEDDNKKAMEILKRLAIDITSLEQ